MNQFLPKSTFQSALPYDFGILTTRNRNFSNELRQFAAKFKMHHMLVHRLCPPEVPLADTTYISTVRHIKQSNWTLGDLIGRPTLDALLAGNSVVSWFIERANHSAKTDILSRLTIRYGVSVPFHNALGNHAALTMFDSVFSDIDAGEFKNLALPLIDSILSADRIHNTADTALSSRETHCLQWAAAGKTSIETGIILGLSPHTVNQYLTAATVKLKAVNRTHAVTKAVRLGLINLSMV
jgi:DNA-binding CsgD family transcriptional regulator